MKRGHFKGKGSSSKHQFCGANCQFPGVEGLSDFFSVDGRNLAAVDMQNVPFFDRVSTPRHPGTPKRGFRVMTGPRKTYRKTPNLRRYGWMSIGKDNRWCSPDFC